MKTGILFDIQRLSIHDGAGIRTSVFFKGCNLRCAWCHNPESQNSKPELRFFASKCIGCGDCVSVCPNAESGKTAQFTESCTGCGKCTEVCYAEARQLCGKIYTEDEVMDVLRRDADAFHMSGGGVTFTGGEPLWQPEFLTSLAMRCKEEGINTAIETAAYQKTDIIADVLPFLDTVICDIKTLDSTKHLSATGKPNELILENIRFMSDRGAKMLLRTPVIPGFNDDADSISAIARFVKSLPAKHSLELLPFHGICLGKYASLGRIWEADGVISPSDERMAELRETVKNILE